MSTPAETPKPQKLPPPKLTNKHMGVLSRKFFNPMQRELEKKTSQQLERIYRECDAHSRSKGWSVDNFVSMSLAGCAYVLLEQRGIKLPREESHAE